MPWRYVEYTLAPASRVDCSICLLETDLHLHNFLLRVPNLDNLSISEIYERYGKPSKIPIRRVEGKPSTPYASLHITYPVAWNMPVNELTDPKIIVADYGTSLVVSQTPSLTLYTPALYAPPENFFKDPITIPTAADVWTLGVILYDVLGERPLFETFVWDLDDIVAEMVNTLGRLPERWWDS
jgi:serine/threonine protein kinase